MTQLDVDKKNVHDNKRFGSFIDEFFKHHHSVDIKCCSIQWFMIHCDVTKSVSYIYDTCTCGYKYVSVTI